MSSEKSGIYYYKNGEKSVSFVEMTDLFTTIQNYDSLEVWPYSKVEKVVIGSEKELKLLPYFSRTKQLQIQRYGSLIANDMGPFLEAMCQCTAVEQLQISLDFYTFGPNTVYEFFKCLQTSFRYLQVLDCKFIGVSKIVNNLFSRLNQNIKKLAIYVEQVKSCSDCFELQQFKNYKCIEYFSLYTSNRPSGFQHMQSILQSTKVFIVQTSDKILPELRDAACLGKLLEKSEHLETLSLDMKGCLFNNYCTTFLSQVLDNLEIIPKNLKQLSLCENTIRFFNDYKYSYHSEMFLHNLQTLLPDLLVFRFNAKGFQYSPRHLQQLYGNMQLGQLSESTLTELPFLKELSDALSKCSQLQELDLRFGGALIASEETFRTFFSSLAIKGLKSLVLDLEKWNEGKRDLSEQQEIHLVSFFLKNLKDTCCESLLSLKINFDGWRVFGDYSFIVDELVEFTNLNELIVMGPKNRLLKKNLPLQILEQISNNKKRYVPLIKVLKRFSVKNSLRIDYLLDIVYQFVNHYKQEFQFKQIGDPFSADIGYQLAQLIVRKDDLFRGKQFFEGFVDA